MRFTATSSRCHSTGLRTVSGRAVSCRVVTDYCEQPAHQIPRTEGNTESETDQRYVEVYGVLVFYEVCPCDSRYGGLGDARFDEPDPSYMRDRENGSEKQTGLVSGESVSYRFSPQPFDRVSSAQCVVFRWNQSRYLYSSYVQSVS
jgi:hypothetical protein